MSRRPDLGGAIALLGAVAVVVAVIAGYVAIGGPGKARDLRLDAERLATLQTLAAGAQCAYGFTGRAPASIAQIRTDFLERRGAVETGVCSGFSLPETQAATLAYRVDGADHIVLCADFARPSPPAEEVTPTWSAPELAVPRPTAGRHCYRIRLLKPAPSAGKAAAWAAPTTQ
jgi:hypothetical protein